MAVAKMGRERRKVMRFRQPMQLLLMRTIVGICLGVERVVVNGSVESIWGFIGNLDTIQIPLYRENHRVKVGFKVVD